MARKKRFLGTHLNFSRWMGIGEIKSNARGIKRLFSSLGEFEESGVKETFAEAVLRLKLTEDDIKERTLHFLKVAMVYMFCAICLIIYALYLYFTRDYIGAFMCLPIISVILSFWFKEHFWYTQMKHRKLGMSGIEWFECLVKGEPKV